MEQSRILSPVTLIDRAPGGVVYARSPHPLGAYPGRITERLESWAAEEPDRAFLARRDAQGAWRSVSYAETLRRVRAIAQSLIDRKLSADRPIVILSGNSIEHGLLALGAMYAGVMYVPVAPAYSLIAREYTTLKAVWSALRPGLVFAAEGECYQRALSNMDGRGVEVVTCSGSLSGTTSFDELTSVDRHGRGGRRAPPCQRRHHRQDPLYVGIDREAQGRDQHAADALREPGNDPDGPAVSRRESARPLRLAALESHLRRQPQLRHRPVQRRNALHRRRQARRPRAFETTVANLSDDRDHGVLQRAAWLRSAACRGFARMRRFARGSSAGCGCSSARRRRCGSRWPTISTPWRVEARGERIPLVTGLGATESAPFALCAGDADFTGGRSACRSPAWS